MTTRWSCALLWLLAAACTTTTKEIKDSDDTSTPNPSDSADTDVVDSDTDLPTFGTDFTRGKWKHRPPIDPDTII